MQARKLHPDLGGTDDAMRTLNEAYEVLSDAEARRAYDAERRPIAVYSMPTAVFNAASSSRSGALGIPYRDKRTVQLIAGSTVCFALGVMLLMGIEGSSNFSANLMPWLIRSLPLALIGAGVVLAHSAGKTPDQQSKGTVVSFLGGWQAIRQGVIWALGFVALLIVLIVAYVGWPK